MDISLNTIGYLMNPAHKHVMDQMNDDRAKSLRRDVKFYKKRIVQAARDLVRGNWIGHEVNGAFMAYCQVLIQHFKTVDKCDILQETYTGMAARDKNHSTPNTTTTSEYANADSLIMRSEKKKERIEEYIDIKRLPNKPKPILPHRRHVDLGTPNLRTKGVKPKKNLTNTYDKDP
jgi:hypothetical protein